MDEFQADNSGGRELGDFTLVADEPLHSEERRTVLAGRYVRLWIGGMVAVVIVATFFVVMRNYSDPMVGETGHILLADKRPSRMEEDLAHSPLPDERLSRIVEPNSHGEGVRHDVPQQGAFDSPVGKAVSIGDSGDRSDWLDSPHLPEKGATVRRNEPQVPDDHKANDIYEQILARLRQSDYAGAVVLWSRAVALRPRVARLHTDEGVSILQKAFANANEAVQLNPDSAKAYTDRGCVLLLSGRPNDAITDFSEAIRLDPECQNAFLYRGYALRHVDPNAPGEGIRDEVPEHESLDSPSERSFAPQIPRAKDSQKAYQEFNAGRQLYWEGKFEESRRALGIAVDNDSTEPIYFYFLALAQVQSGDLREARQTVATAARLERDRPMPNWGQLMERCQGNARAWLENERREAFAADGHRRQGADAETDNPGREVLAAKIEPTVRRWRVWTDSSGHVFEASLERVGYRGGSAVLRKREDGRLYDFPLELLSSADQDYVRAHSK